MLVDKLGTHTQIGTVGTGADRAARAPTPSLPGQRRTAETQHAPTQGSDRAATVAEKAAVQDAGNNKETAASDQASTATDRAADVADAKVPAPIATRLSISFDQASRLFVSRSVEVESGEVRDQYPADFVLRRVAAFVESLEQKQENSLDIKA